MTGIFMLVAGAYLVILAIGAVVLWFGIGTIEPDFSTRKLGRGPVAGSLHSLGCSCLALIRLVRSWVDSFPGLLRLS